MWFMSMIIRSLFLSLLKSMDKSFGDAKILSKVTYSFQKGERVGIIGVNVDGHDFAEAVIEKGAIAVLAEKKLENFDHPYLLVESTFEATKAIAEFYRKNLDAIFIGVTGSVGKTSTKEFIAEVLCKKFRVQKTQGNLNNEWGVPFTIFSIKENTEIAVVEMGISDFGEMSRLSKNI